jgi:hypothetical protein
MELLFIHNSGETKVGDKQICVVLGCAEEKVLGFEISVDNAMIVKVSHS